MKKQVAEQICQKLEAIIGQMDGLNNFLIANADEADRKRIQPVLAMCVAELDIEILAATASSRSSSPGFSLDQGDVFLDLDRS